MPVPNTPDDFVSRAAEEILGDAALRDELTDSEAQPLIDWALAQVKALAGNATLLASGPEALDETTGTVKRIMGRINRFVRLRADGDQEAMQAELDRLGTLSGRLPGAPQGVLPVEQLSGRILEEIVPLSTEQVVRRLLAVVGGAPAPEPPAPPQTPAPQLAAPPAYPPLTAPPDRERLIAPDPFGQLAAPPARERLTAPPRPGTLPPPAEPAADAAEPPAPPEGSAR